MLNTLVLKCGA